MEKLVSIKEPLHDEPCPTEMRFNFAKHGPETVNFIFRFDEIYYLATLLVCTSEKQLKEQAAIILVVLSRLQNHTSLSI